MKKFLISFALVLLTLFILGFLLYEVAFAPTESSIVTREVVAPAEITILAEGLSVPWDVARLPSGTLLVTERPGSLVRINTDGSLSRVDVPRVSSLGEGGLMGIALHPDFAENRYLYLYRTVDNAGRRENEIVRYTYNDNHSITDETLILGNIPGARFHDGGALSFGPDGFLYVTTGDALEPALAQDVRSIAGKILRITDTGDAAPGNPFNDRVYSYGHRNGQGLAFDSQGRLWSTEHGRSGVQSGYDELNLIVPGGNYGWPDSQGDEVLPGTIAPTFHSGANETWAPGSLAYIDGTLFFAGLRGERLYRVNATDTQSNQAPVAFFERTYGRLRASRIFGDSLYLTTSNTDGRGSASPGDDKLIVVPLRLLQDGF